MRHRFEDQEPHEFRKPGESDSLAIGVVFVLVIAIIAVIVLFS